MKKIILLLFLFFILINAKGQNMVPNGDFEQFSGCPDWVAQFDSVFFWMNPSTTGSPDYFNSCDTGIVNVPNSLYGYQSAHSGVARSGILVFAGGATNAREYMEVPLNSTLIASQCYYFEMYVSLADNFKYMSDAAEVYFSDTAITGIPNSQLLPFTSQISNNTGNFDTLSWRLVSGTYTATGGENYVLIGNFKNDANTSTTFYNPSGMYDYAYIYIDDVSLSLCTGTEEIPNSNNQFSIYPNPVKDELKIHSKNRIEEIKIYDVLGKEIYHHQNPPSDLRLPTSGFKSGIYFIEINDGKNVSRKKFMKF